eukprot:gnl/TRDRNA2_/TRDRNA2_149121_c0_seq1.p1 gnl/TRDRNA2_/TRDRNA2_149121_c0~~gnl/TRDRNA2_/TRDRNA2_149121_c0_seq1.p1  ORF type:complete len:200 (+),score=37.85 gnl/TRDRNA2_/TRDRNA2_149121_c0_seq1:85-600(+)
MSHSVATQPKTPLILCDSPFKPTDDDEEPWEISWIQDAICDATFTHWIGGEAEATGRRPTPLPEWATISVQGSLACLKMEPSASSAGGACGEEAWQIPVPDDEDDDQLLQDPTVNCDVPVSHGIDECEELYLSDAIKTETNEEAWPPWAEIEAKLRQESAADDVSASASAA